MKSTWHVGTTPGAPLPGSRPSRPFWLPFRMVLGALTVVLPAYADGSDSNSANLAPLARVTASAQFNGSYGGQQVVDGKIPAVGSQADVGMAWCVPQDRAANATLTFEWPEPVTVGEVVYYGRTAWLWNENFRRVQICLAGSESKPLLESPLKAGHGPQRIRLPEPVRTTTLTLRFPAADDGPNPGASEIRVYEQSPTDGQLGTFPPPPKAGPALPTSPVHDSPELAAKLVSGGLGFDRLLVIQRRPITPTHVYTYHCEGLQPGGGLFVLDLMSGRLEPLVDASEGVILDADLSFDGHEIVFSWMRDMQRFQVYRIGLDGAGLRQLTDGDSFNFNACWLPDGGIAFLSTRRSAYAYCWSSPAGILHRMGA
ncbi:MAG: hypothetical protein KDM81_20435, partial [Verrucomicrobiae bacterium]|nr:hypothetical protein [Verrucomicrobiae bacterium]